MKGILEARRHLPVLLVLVLITSALWAQSQQSKPNAGVEEERSEKPARKRAAATVDPNINGLYEQARKYAARGNLEMAIAKYEELLQQADPPQDAEERLLALRSQLEQKQLAERIERSYAAGLTALKARDWTRAALELEKVVAKKPGFRDAAARLAEAQGKLAREGVESVAVRYYAIGMAAMEWHDLEEARIAFERTNELKPGYRDVTTHLQKLTEVLEKSSATNDTTAEQSANADSLYQMANRAASQGDWEHAAILFETLHVVAPNYGDVVDRLAQARAAEAAAPRLNSAGANVSSSSNLAVLQIGGKVAALLLVPAMGWFLLSPSLRARRFLSRHDYRSAARVYEKLLARYPMRVKYFPRLASIYLQEGRKDDGAMKVYRTVLQLNLATNHREEINTVVAQQYLQEGRTDSDAIEVLEKQLQAELHRQNRALVKAG